ncbi:protein of unknown function [Modestobacter italicus]|uniref:Uncharacterized protein n=1 Tax=Modestobacter italicus (strain DSM 44449 / CECT 9708 / BC 501) TaxID=2732864 RepID=I4EX47_MODI5|nr:hypothetical protein [Modestobacter marinus]CCH87960.1 protein of unknown function [Modestobacter marinus]
MTDILRSTVPIASAAELSLWWAEVLSGDHHPGATLAMLWLDSLGHRIGRCLRITGVADPDLRAAQAVLQVHRAVTADGVDDGHVAFALSRPGGADVTAADEEWADVLDALLVDRDEGTWSLHLAAGGWITPVVHPPAVRFDPRRVALRSPGDLLDREWLVGQNSGHDDAVARDGEGSVQPGDR